MFQILYYHRKTQTTYVRTYVRIGAGLCMCVCAAEPAKGQSLDHHGEQKELEDSNGGVHGAHRARKVTRVNV